MLGAGLTEGVGGGEDGGVRSTRAWDGVRNGSFSDSVGDCTGTY
jgi:hypothetical protein